MAPIKGSKLSGCLLSVGGAIITFAWLFHWLVIANFFQNKLGIDFNDALCFLLVGFGLLIPDKYLRQQMVGRSIVGICIFSIGSFSLISNFNDFFVGINNLFLNAEFLHTKNMSINNAIAFMLAGLVFVLFPYLNKSYNVIQVKLYISAILILGISAVIGSILRFEFLYNWYPPSFSAGIASAQIILGVGLWSMVNQSIYYRKSTVIHIDKKIITTSGIIGFGITLLIGLSILIIVSLENEISNQFINVDVLTYHRLLISILVSVIVGIFLLCCQLLPQIKNMINLFNQLLIANRLLEESENKFRSAFDNAAIGMALISIEGKCIKVNKALCSILGYNENDLINLDLNQIIYPEDKERDHSYFQQLLQGKINSHRSEQRFFNKSGDIIWTLVNTSLIRDAKKNPLHLISQLQNITIEKNTEEQLRQLAYFDSLTGLANRNKLEQYITDALYARRNQAPKFAILFLDLDHFKNINDTIGHDAGDILLQIVADRLKNVVRKTDIVARLGGDEFVLVITDVDSLDVIAHVAQKLLNKMLNPVIIKGHEIYVTTSIGISFFPYDGQDIQALMKNADLALYRAKEQGRNNFQFCTPEMTMRAQQKMLRQNALAHALLKNEFCLYYLPIIDLNRHEITGIEALLRWPSPEYGMVSPEEIISLADETGFIIPLGEWILKTASKQVKMWGYAGLPNLTLAVNLSAKQFKQPNFIEMIMRLLSEANLSAECLELDITEGLIMQDPENTSRILQALKKLGVKIAIDDFGTGYSSLSYLKNFFIDKIKIDKTFIHQISSDEPGAVIVMAMIAMANKLEIKTIAEGVETKEQYEFLLKEQCAEMQGYYLCPPLSVDEMTKFLENPHAKLNMLKAVREQVTRSSRANEIVQNK